MAAAQIQSELDEASTPERASTNEWFFKTGKGEYGEGDKFRGVRVPVIRKLAKKFKDIEFDELQALIDSDWHEDRLTGLIILTLKYPKSNLKEQKKLFDFFMKNVKQNKVNNWDLVDSSCHKIAGPFLFKRSRDPLYELSKSGQLWQERVSIITTYYFIKRGDFADTLLLSEKFLEHEHDLMHKAAGWMLREVGKQDVATLEQFLKKHYKQMPRTMLRYSIEKFSKSTRDKYLKGQI